MDRSRRLIVRARPRGLHFEPFRIGRPPSERAPPPQAVHGPEPQRGLLARWDRRFFHRSPPRRQWAPWGSNREPRVCPHALPEALASTSPYPATCPPEISRAAGGQGLILGCLSAGRHAFQ